MKVSELIKSLEQCDPNSTVLINDPEGGSWELERVQPVEVILNFRRPRFEGPHEVVDKSSRDAALSYYYTYYGREGKVSEGVLLEYG